MSLHLGIHVADPLLIHVSVPLHVLKFVDRFESKSQCKPLVPRLALGAESSTGSPRRLPGLRTSATFVQKSESQQLSWHRAFRAFRLS